MAPTLKGLQWRNPTRLMQPHTLFQYFENLLFSDRNLNFIMLMYLEPVKITKNTNQAPKFPRRCLECIKTYSPQNAAVCKYI